MIPWANFIFSCFNHSIYSNSNNILSQSCVLSPVHYSKAQGKPLLSKNTFQNVSPQRFSLYCSHKSFKPHYTIYQIILHHSLIVSYDCSSFHNWMQVMSFRLIIGTPVSCQCYNLSIASESYSLLSKVSTNYLLFSNQQSKPRAWSQHIDLNLPCNKIQHLLYNWELLIFTILRQ